MQPLIIPARSWGPATLFLRDDTELTGQVHSIFQRVINLAFPGHCLVSISRSDVSNSPTNVVTELPPTGTWLTADISPGGKVLAKNNFLYLGSLSIDLATANPWLPAIRRRVGAPSNQEITENILQLGKWAGQHLQEQGLSPLLIRLPELLDGTLLLQDLREPFLRVAATSILGLVQAYKNADIHGISRHAQSLIGLGPGLTPSGDDFLAGLMAAMVFAEKALPPKLPVKVKAINQAIAGLAPGLSNELSCQLLAFAAHGEVTETMEEVILALLHGREDALEPSARQLLGIGASSGADQLLGILLGICLYNNFSLRAVAFN